MKKVTTSFIFRLLVVVALATSGLWLYMHHNWLWLCLVVPLFFVSIYWFHRLYTYNTRKVAFLLDAIENDDPAVRFYEHSPDKDNSLVNMMLNRIARILYNVKQETAQREKYYELILDFVETGIVVLNSKGAVYQKNKKATQLLGMDVFTHTKQLSRISDELKKVMEEALPGDKSQVLRDPTFIESTDPWPGNHQFGERVLGFSTDLVTEKAIRWMKEQDGNQPFLMCCHFKATHEPYDYPIRMEHLYDGVTFPEPENLLDWGPETNGRSFKGQTLEELERRWRIASQDPDKWWCRYPGLPFSTEGMQRTAARRASYQKFIRDYLRCGATVDDNIGKLLNALDEMNIADNTIVIYVSDQGYFLGEHGFFDKRMFYEESARMPFVIRYPKKVPAGKRLDDLILNVDFAPTLAEFAGVKMENVQGDSFVSNLEGNTPTDWRKEIYYRYWTNHAIRPAHFAIRSDRYKLIFYYARNLDMTDTENFDFTPSWDFYDLQNDPHENHNAYNDPKYAPVIKQMKKDLLRLRKETGDTDEKYPEMQKLLEKYYNK